ncbi:hypothetical protein Pmani_013583 [Petrolisthes manimaculis]|uniref:Uncharacterized protein n=1 Tax=Petrolisthes manimaculis TaxID=1843537 RepID=A0AAE1TV41_9EUCA|nr:hypothetical protein Pmani_028925 [Petrolisthes manimaculis]KAK4315169.1 hypothetical protein Pmani_013583 [Petrolisthes manimaculis]
MPGEDKSDGSGSSDGHSGSLASVEKVVPVVAGNIRARVGLYVKDGERLRADFHSLYRALPDQRKKKERHKIRRKSKKFYKDKKKKESEE